MNFISSIMKEGEIIAYFLHVMHNCTEISGSLSAVSEGSSSGISSLEVSEWIGSDLGLVFGPKYGFSTFSVYPADLPDCDSHWVLFSTTGWPVTICPPPCFVLFRGKFLETRMC